MKTSKSKSASQRPAVGIASVRTRAVIAESRWKAAREQVRTAKQKRKEAKLVVCLAKEQAKSAKEDLLAARKALTKLESKSPERPGAKSPAGKSAAPPAKPVVPAAIPAKRKSAVRKRRSRPAARPAVVAQATVPDLR